MRFSSSITSILLVASSTHALDLDISSTSSIQDAAKAIAKGIMVNYTGAEAGQIPGLFGDSDSKGATGPYLWWSFGAIWDAMVDYQYFTGDNQYNDVVQKALLWQRGQDDDYMPANQTKDEGNADQATWALTAMNAAERNFSAPPSGIPSWLKLAQNTFDSQAPRWDKKTCKGGLRWQIFPFNNGYNYKNGFSNGQFMQLAARLYALTGNQTYSDWAELAYSWAVDAGIVKDDGTTYDGAQTEDDCSQVNKLQLTSNSAVWLYGSAVMANATKGDKTWTTRAQSILNHAKTVYIKNNIMVETACETNGKCSTEQRFFKGIFAQHLARTMQMMPSTADTIKPIIQANAQAVAKTGCENANNCVYIWTGNSKNGGSDLGSQFSSLQAIQGNLADRGKAASSSNTSSTSTSGGPGSSNSSSTSASGSSGTASQTAAPTGAAGELKASSWTALVLALASVCAFGIA